MPYPITVEASPKPPLPRHRPAGLAYPGIPRRSVRPGLGRLLVDSVQFRDYTMVQALTMVFAAGVVGLNVVVDLFAARLDPRVSAS